MLKKTKTPRFAGYAVCTGISVLALGTGYLSTGELHAQANLPVSSDNDHRFAANCRPEAIQAAAARSSIKITVSEVANGPKLPGGSKYVPASGSLPAYCQVSGTFETNPVSGKTANFLATLPANWNGKYLQFGCFGHCGFFALNDAASPVGTIVAQGYPYQVLTKGYASFGTDQGHNSKGAGDWALKAPGQLDEDALTDFLYRSNQVLARAGKELTTAFYAQTNGAAQSVARSYFAGCSGGGRDALVAASRFPEEFDGIIAGSPYADMMGVAFQNGGAAIAAIRSPDADISPELMARVDPIVKAQCDKLDGVEDGLIQNPAACNFRPERDLPICHPNSTDGQCFTKAQVETISTLITAVTDEHGAVVQPGFSISELQFVAHMQPPKDPNALDPWPNSDDFSASKNSLWPLVNATIKTFAHHGDPDFHTRSILSFSRGGPGAITDFRTVVPRSKVDFTRAAVQAGLAGIPEDAAGLFAGNRKLLIWSNLSDEKLTPYMAINYYKRLADLHGGYAHVQKNARLFAIPGSDHCSIGGVGPKNFDALTAMENWVEQGKAPDALPAALYNPKSPVVDVRLTPIRTMPLCKFPTMARYSGAGDMKDGKNWSCPEGDTSMLRIGESGRRAGVSK